MDMIKIPVLAVIGPSASGKNYIVNELIKKLDKNVYNLLIPYTSRPPRINEKDKVDYNFVNEDFFKDDNNNFIDMNFFNNWFYGNRVQDLDMNKINICITNINGLKQLINIPNIELIILKTNASFLTRIKRSIKREEKFKLEFLRRGITDYFDFLNIDKKIIFTKNIELFRFLSTEKNVERILFYLRHWSFLNN